MTNTDEFEEQLRHDGYLDIKHRLVERGEDTPPVTMTSIPACWFWTAR